MKGGVLLAGQCGTSPTPLRKTARSPIRNSTTHNRAPAGSPVYAAETRGDCHDISGDVGAHRHRGTRRPPDALHTRTKRSATPTSKGEHDPDAENSPRLRSGRSMDPSSHRITSSSDGECWERRGTQSSTDLNKYATDEGHRRLRHSSSIVDRGLAGIGTSLRSSWSALSVRPATPNGEAVPALLSHLAELRSVCKRQRESGRSIRKALLRKQGQLDEVCAEAAGLRAELGFIVGDMLGALQSKPTIGTVFQSLAERIRSDLGAEEAAVYIDMGDGTLWLIPGDDGGLEDDGEPEEVSIRKGVGVVGLVAMGAIPRAASVAAREGRCGIGGDGVDVLLLNDGLEAFDDGTAVETALLRASRRRRGGDDHGHNTGAAGGANASGVTVKNMLLARVAWGADPGASDCGSWHSRVDDDGFWPPDPPAAVVQALNKQAAPGRFTQDDASAVRALAPAVATGCRLIMSLLHHDREKQVAGCYGGGEHGAVRASRAPCGGMHASPEDEHGLLECLGRARESLRADRARLFVLLAGGNLQLWYQDPPRSSQRCCPRAARAGRETAVSEASMAAATGLQGVALRTGRPTRLANALSAPVHDRELDLREGFLARSVLCAPLPRRARSSDPADRDLDGGPAGILRFDIGHDAREATARRDGEYEGFASPRFERKKLSFVEDDERSAEWFAREIADKLSLLDGSFQLRTSVTSLAGGGGHVGASVVAIPPRPPRTLGEEGYRPREADIGQGPRAGMEGQTSLGASADTAAHLRCEHQPAGSPAQQALGARAEAAARRRDVRARNSSEGGRDFDGQSSSEVGFAAREVRCSAAREAAGKTLHASGGRALASSTASTTATLSPLATGLGASTATVAPRSASVDPPPPPSPATDHSNEYGSPDASLSPGEQQRSSVLVETTRDRSWAAAHKIVDACRTGLAAGICLRPRRPRPRDTVGDGPQVSSSSSAGEGLASAVCALISSVLPGCSATLLLLSAETGRLSEAFRPHKGQGGTEGAIPITREDVAHRALASGKALLAQATVDGASQGSTPAAESNGRVFCIPLRDHAGARSLGVLQVFLLAQALSEAAKEEGPSSSRGATAHPPTPAFFMATKIVADSVGLLLEWCEELDRSEADRSSDALAFAEAEQRSQQVHERSRRDLEAKLRKELSVAGETHACVMVEGANAHARAIATLLEGQEAQAAAAACMAVRAKDRNHARRVLAAWRALSARSMKARKISGRLSQRRRAWALAKWRLQASSRSRLRAAEMSCTANAERRGLRRSIERWAKAAERGRWNAERRAWGVRLIADALKRRSTLKQRFWAWRAATRAMEAAQRELAHGEAEKLHEARVNEEIERAEIRAQALADRAADVFQRHRQKHAARAGVGTWKRRAQERMRRRDRGRCWSRWWRQHLLAGALARWRAVAAPRGVDDIQGDIALCAQEMGGPLSSPGKEKHKQLSPRASMDDQGVSSKAVGTFQRDGAACAFGQACAPVQASPASGADLLGPTEVDRTPSDAAAGGHAEEQPSAGKGPRAPVKPDPRSFLAEAAATAFRRQRCNVALLRIVTQWRRATVQSCSRRGALARVWSGGCKRGLRESFGRWREETRVACLAAERVEAATARTRIEEEEERRMKLLVRVEDQLRQQDRAMVQLQDELEAARAEAASAVGAAASAAAQARVESEGALRAREQESQRERERVQEMQRDVEALRAEVSASVARQQAADAHLLERGARVSLLSLAAARAFYDGRARLRTARALTVWRSNARFRRSVAAGIAGATKSRLSRCLRAWKAVSDGKRHQCAAASAAVKFASDAVARATRDDARTVLQRWAETSRRGKRAGIAATRLREGRQRAAMQTWRRYCLRKRAAIATTSGSARRLGRLALRQALRRWRFAAAGFVKPGLGAVGADVGVGGRAATRLMHFAIRVERAAARRRAKRVMRAWITRTQRARMRTGIESRAKLIVTRRQIALSLYHWRAAAAVGERMRRALERGDRAAALRGVVTGWCAWREAVHRVTRRKAMASAKANTAVAPGGESSTTAPAREPERTHSQEAIFLGGATSAALAEPEALTHQQQAIGSGVGITSQSGETRRLDVLQETDVVRSEGRDGRVSRGSGENVRSLLDMLVDLCAAPPPYTIGSGIEALGRQACAAAVQAFGLLSASLFDVAGAPHAVATRVATVQGGEDRRQRQQQQQQQQEGEAEGARNPVPSTAAETVGRDGLSERESLGEGPVGIAARSARPICVEEILPASCSDELSQGGGHGSPTRHAAPGASSTILCVPVMLQAAAACPSPWPSEDHVEGGGANLPPSVEVVGVLRAVRSGEGSFAGDDARAISVFCGPLALAMTSERVLHQSQKASRTHAGRGARAVRRKACQRMVGLLVEGAVAGALLGREKSRETAKSLDSRHVNPQQEDLWARVAAPAAKALGCERVDLLRLAHVARGCNGAAVPLVNLLWQPRSSAAAGFRSHRKRSRDALMAVTKASSSSRLSSDGGDHSVGGVERMARNWLCVPVMGAQKGEDSTREGEGDSGRTEEREAVTVCCAMNKAGARGFDDVDEALLSTIAALYAVAASWLPPEPMKTKSNSAIRRGDDRERLATRAKDEDDASACNANGDPQHALGSTADGGQRVGDSNVGESGALPVNRASTAPPLRQRSPHDAAWSTAPVPPGSRQGVAISCGAIVDGCDPGVEGTLRTASAYTRGNPGDGVATNERQQSCAKGLVGRDDSVVTPLAFRQPVPRPAPRLLADPEAPTTSSPRLREGFPTQPPTVLPPAEDVRRGVARQPYLVDFRTARDAGFRERAERAERALDATRNRLCRALEDGALSAAAAVASAASAKATATAPHADLDSSASAAIGRKSNTAPERPPPRHRKSKSPHRGVATNAGTYASTTPQAQGHAEGRNAASPSQSTSSGLSESSREIDVHQYTSGDVSADSELFDSDREAAAAERLRRRGDVQRRARRGPLASASVDVGTDVTSDRSKEYDDNDTNDDADGAAGRSSSSSSSSSSSNNNNRARRPRRRAELRRSDIARMREVVARLKIATFQLEAERAERSMGRRGVGGGPMPSSLYAQRVSPVRGVEGAATEDRAPVDATDDASGGIGEAEATALLQENASLRRKLRGLVALEELEGRAVAKGLLPLTRAGAPGGDFFPPSDN